LIVFFDRFNLLHRVSFEFFDEMRNKILVKKNKLKLDRYIFKFKMSFFNFSSTRPFILLFVAVFS